MKHAVILARAPHQFEFGRAFGEGLERHGWRVTVTNEYQPCDMLVCWGVRRTVEIAAQKRLGGEVCVLERGYLGNRFHWTSVSFGGGLNGRGEFRGVRSDPARFDTHFGPLMQPWSDRGGYVLLIGQVPTDMSVRHVDINGWYADTAAKLKAAGHEVRFRPHPMAVKRGMGGHVAGAPALGGELADALAGASLCVTFSSNTGVEAVLAGVPTIACDIGSMAWDVTGHAAGEPAYRGTRGEWAAQLAWKQFSADEMASGFCWEVVGGDRMEAAA